MSNWFKQLLQKLSGENDKVLTLERDLQNLRLENQALNKLKQELERQRSGETNRTTEAVQTEIEQLFTDISSPITQLLTQTYLLEKEDKPVQTKDVLAVVKRLLHTLEDKGLMITGKVGETVPFEPNYHQPLSANASLTPGSSVIVRLMGISYEGKVIKKAGVEAAQCYQ